MEVNGKLRALAALSAGKNLATHWMGDWVGPKIGLYGFREGEKKYVVPAGIAENPRVKHRLPGEFSASPHIIVLAL
jgi:hypothetical protein